LERYSTFLVRSYIDLHPSLKWCGDPRCGKAVCYTGSMYVTDVTCVCGFKMCFRCGQAVHSPASCGELRQWKMECEGEGKDLSFILKTSKQCPKCNVAIHRVSGCNHIRCKICRHEFCWTCLGPWTQHGDATGGFYQCNLFDREADTKMTKERHKTGDAVARFMHYLTRYQNHEEAQSFAKTKRDKLKAQLQEEKDDFMEMKLKLLIPALDQIVESRRVLKYTYVVAFYMEDSDPRNKNLFEHLQEMLEKNTEYLQELVEGDEDIEQESYVDFEQLRNFTQLTKTFTTRVIEFASEQQPRRKK
jgi:ariadne-1